MCSNVIQRLVKRRVAKLPSQGLWSPNASVVDGVGYQVKNKMQSLPPELRCMTMLAAKHVVGAAADAAAAVPVPAANAGWQTARHVTWRGLVVEERVGVLCVRIKWVIEHSVIKVPMSRTRESIWKWAEAGRADDAWRRPRSSCEVGCTASTVAIGGISGGARAERMRVHAVRRHAVCLTRAHTQRVLGVAQADASFGAVVQKSAIEFVQRHGGIAGVFEFNEAHGTILLSAETHTLVAARPCEDGLELVFGRLDWQVANI